MKAGGARVRLSQHQNLSGAGEGSKGGCSSELQVSGSRGVSEDREKLPEVSSEEGDALEEQLSQEVGMGQVLLELQAQLQEVFQWANIAYSNLDSPKPGGDGGTIKLDTLSEKATRNAATGLLKALQSLPLSEETTWELVRETIATPFLESEEHNPAEPQEGGAQGMEDVESIGEAQEGTDEGWETASQVGMLTTQPSPSQDDPFSDLQQYLVQTDVCFSSIAGGEATKRILKECVIYPSMWPHLFQGIRQPWKGILLYGPPGTGKTELAKAAAGESGAAFLMVTPSVLLSKFMGESEKLMSRMFSFAKHAAKTQGAAIIFLDEVDSLAVSRGSESNDQPGLRRLLAELLVQFNALDGSHRVVVLAATNRMEDIDPALLRRFERRIEVGLPGEEERVHLMNIKLASTPLESDVDLRQIARLTEGFSGAQLELLCREAAMLGLREVMEICNHETRCGTPPSAVRAVSAADFHKAYVAFRPPVAATSEFSERDEERRRKAAKGCSSACTGDSLRDQSQLSPPQQPSSGSGDVAVAASVKIKEER